MRINNTIFKTVLDYSPDVYIWLGDAVYLDRGNNQTFNYSTMSYQMQDKSVEDKMKIYDLTFNDWYYQQMRDKFPILGVWDDHDYGNDNAGIEYKHKHMQKQMYLDFLQEPIHTRRRESYKGGNDQKVIEKDKVAHQGVYQDYWIILKGEKVQDGEIKDDIIKINLYKLIYLIKVHVILLDIRFNMKEGDMLGEVQWEWLEATFKESNTKGSDVVLIGSGVQFLNYDNFFLSESLDYAQYIHLYRRTVFMSGDVHYSQFFKTPCSLSTNPQTMAATSERDESLQFEKFPFVEFSSSGMTHNCLTGEYNCKGLLTHVYTDIWKDSPYFMRYNFVGVEISRTDKGQIQVDMHILDIRSKIQ